jgi:anti-sigma-K factor RskA
MSTRDHTSYREEIGAYLLGALTDPERQAFEQHLRECAECREEVERLRPAADALPRSVEQIEPPPRLKASLMEVVERETRRPARVPARRSLRERLLIPQLRLQPVLAVGALVLALLVGYGFAQLGDDQEVRTIAATVDDSRVPQASATLRIPGDGESGGILRVQGLRTLGPDRVYQAWVQRDGQIVPQPTFEVRPDGGGAAAVPEDLSDAQAVMVTREPRGGSRAPSENPILTVRL